MGCAIDSAQPFSFAVEDCPLDILNALQSAYRYGS